MRSSSRAQPSESFLEGCGEESDANPLTQGSARALLLTILGEFFVQAPGPVWTAALVQVLDDLGIAEKAARQAISRAATAGWMVSERRGRQVGWRLAQLGRDIVERGRERVRSLAPTAQAWDGRWLVLYLSLPDNERTLRNRTYRALNWLGFGSAQSGVWICPHVARRDGLLEVLTELGVPRKNVLLSCGTLEGLGGSAADVAARAWDVAGIRAHYQSLLTIFGSARSHGAGLTSYLRLLHALQRLPYVDPGLPGPLLPPDWDGNAAIKALHGLRHAWRDDAHRQWSVLVEEAAPVS